MTDDDFGRGHTDRRVVEGDGYGCLGTGSTHDVKQIMGVLQVTKEGRADTAWIYTANLGTWIAAGYQPNADRISALGQALPKLYRTAKANIVYAIATQGVYLNHDRVVAMDFNRNVLTDILFIWSKFHTIS